MFALVFLVTTFAFFLATPIVAEAKYLPWIGVCPCEWRAPGVFWRDKADFVQCAIEATHAARAAGTITRRQARRSMRTARRSVPCGDPDYTRKATCGGPERRTCPDLDTYCGYIGPACEDSRWGYCLIRGCSPIGNSGPVCGCDGRTYDRPCLAVGAGVEIAHFGSCEAGEVAK